MNKSDPPRSFGVFKPVGHTVLVFPDAHALEQAVSKLVAAGLVHEIVGDDGLKRYDGNLEPHQHMVCDETGRIFDVQVDPKVLKSLRPLDPETGKPVKGWKARTTPGTLTWTGGPLPDDQTRSALSPPEPGRHAAGNKPGQSKGQLMALGIVVPVLHCGLP